MCALGGISNYVRSGGLDERQLDWRSAEQQFNKEAQGPARSGHFRKAKAGRRDRRSVGRPQAHRCRAGAIRPGDHSM
jgi:hypothetical protein